MKNEMKFVYFIYYSKRVSMLCNFIFTVKTLDLVRSDYLPFMYLLASPIVIIRSFKDEKHADVLIREIPV